MKKNKYKKWIWAVLILAGIGAGLMYAKSKQKKVLTSVETAVAEKRTIFARVTESGSIQPTVEVPVAPDVSGEVVELYVKEGQYVKKGQLLAVIRPDNYKAALEQSQAAVNSANSDYLQAQASQEQIKVNIKQDSVSLARIRKMREDKIASQVDFENAQLKYNISISQLSASQYTIQAAFYRMKSSEASLKQAQQNLNRTNIYASMDGTITRLNVEVGQRVVGTMQMAGTEMIKIADLSSVEVVAEINENEIVNIHLGDSALVEVDAFSHKKFFGKVTDIAYSASKTGLGSSDQVTSFQVKVKILPTSYQEMMRSKGEIASSSASPFRPGMSALMEIYTDRVIDVVAVPLQAVTLHHEPKKEEKPEGFGPPDEDAPKLEEQKAAKPTDAPKKEVVFIYENGKVKEVPVKIGISDDDYIELKDGVSAGAKVVIGPYTVLTKELQDGMEVEEGIRKEGKKE